MMKKLLTLTVIFGLFFLGCGEDVTTPVSDNSPNNTEQEIPTEIQAKLSQHQPTIEDFDESIQFVSTDFPWDGAVDGYSVYGVTFLWGNIPGHTDSNLTGTDWSGSLTVENAEGVVEVVHEIDFEAGQDSVIAHDAVHFAIWASHTNGDIDGLSFLVFIQHGDDSDALPFVRFRTALFELVLSPQQLSHYSALHMVSNTQGVAVMSRRIWPNNCPGGFISGQWAKPTVFADSGHFSGIWHNHSGNPIGVMAGTFWITPDGARRFHAHISHTALTVVIGEAHGEWAYDDIRMCPMCGAGHGWFHGRYKMFESNDHPPQFGRLWGVFGDYGLPPDALTLPLRGVWRADCIDRPHDEGVPNTH